MGLLINRVERRELQPGDHIYTYRTAFTYSHHGIFVGENKVVHVTSDKNLNSSSGISSDSSFYNSRLICSSYPECGFRKPNSGVVRSCLDCFLRNESLYRYEYGVSQSVFFAHVRGGTCTTAKSDPPAEVIRRASYLLERGFGNYDLLQNNCEDFALYCKTGLLTLDKIKTDIGKTGGSHQKKANKLGVGASGQVSSVSSVFGAPLEAFYSSTLTSLMPSSVSQLSRATAMAVTYFLNRYEADIGVRDDVMKVAVEDLAVKLGWEGHHHEEVANDSEASNRHFLAMNSVSIPILDGTNFSDWSEQILFYLGLHDLDLALRTEKPPTIIDSSNAEKKAIYNSWERSDRLSILFMRMNIANNIKLTLPKCDSAKEFFKTVEEHFRSADKALTRTLIDEPITKKFDDTHGIHEHILEMKNLATKLRDLGMNVDELFLVQLILNSLPPQYGSFQIHYYNTIKGNWNVNELINMLVQEEARLEQQGHHSVHLVSQEDKKIELPEVNGPPQVIEVHERRQNNVIEPPEVNEHPQIIEIHERRQNNVTCYFCNQIGHIKKNCHKRRAWFEKRGIPYNPNHKPK